MHYIFNHVDIEIKYHDGSGEDWEGARLMSAKVTPRRYELHKQHCQGGPQWPYGLCAELDSWVKRSGFGICPVHCVLLVCETLNSQCQGNMSKCWTRIASNWLALHARETGIKLLQESLDKSACFICSFFLHHSAWMFYICQPTWSNLVVIKVVNFKLVSVLLMDFFLVLTWVWEKEKNWVLIETQCHTPVYCTCRFYSLRFDSSQGVRCMTRQKNHLFLHSNLVNSTVSSTRKARIWNVMVIYQPWVFQLR